MFKAFNQALAGLAAGAIMLSSAASAETLIVTTINAPNHWSETEGMMPFMECVKKGTNGGIDFNYFHSSQIANVNNALDALKTGIANISFVATFAVSDKMPLANILLLPGLGDNIAQITRAMRKVSEGDTPYAKELAANGVKPLIFNVFPPNQIMMRGEGIKTLDGFKNKKIRVAGGSLQFGMSALGAVPVTIAFGEIYLSLQQGTVDGYLFSSVVVKNFSLQEVTKAMSRNGNFGISLGMISIDSKTFDKLSPDKQKVLVDCGKAQEEHLAEYAEKTNNDLNDEFAKRGIDVYNFTDENKAAINDKLKLAQTDYINRLSKNGLPAQQALDLYLAALK
jgi:TRAP-type C4-dicarboxylate transport system substrate-binding protein